MNVLQTLQIRTTSAPNEIYLPSGEKAGDYLWQPKATQYSKNRYAIRVKSDQSNKKHWKERICLLLEFNQGSTVDSKA